MLTARAEPPPDMRAGGGMQKEPDMTTLQEVNDTPETDRASADDLRAQMYRIIDELGAARSERAEKLKEEFEVLWKQIPGEPTVH